MPPRKKSRLTPVVGTEVTKQTAFETLCLPDTGFMVDFLEFFTRDDFEKYLQLTCKRINQLILTHFHSKSYRYLEDATLKCYLLKGNMLLLSLSKPATENRHSTLRWDPSARQWTNSYRFGGFSKMRQFLDMSFTTDNYLKDNLVSRAELLRETKLFRCRQLKCSSMDDVMLPLWDYPEIYALESVEVNFTTIESMESEAIVQLVENRALYPHSQTTFVFSEITNDFLRNIANKIMESVKAQSFRIIFAIYDGSELPDDKMYEFRLENNRTREVLHILHVPHNEVPKYCKFDPKTRYFILERLNV